jgi:hypothetical protein
MRTQVAALFVCISRSSLRTFRQSIRGKSTANNLSYAQIGNVAVLFQEKLVHNPPPQDQVQRSLNLVTLDHGISPSYSPWLCSNLGRLIYTYSQFRRRTQERKVITLQRISVHPSFPGKERIGDKRNTAFPRPWYFRGKLKRLNHRVIFKIDRVKA